MTEHPRVFISYSHESSEHKRWVAELGSRLRQDGVDVILDQWDLGLGDDVTLFMEQGLSDSHRVLTVCTDEYVRKANAGEGGVGYERMIVTAELVRNLGTNKFIPLIRQSSGPEKVPRCLATRVYVDMTNGIELNQNYDNLLREIHQVPSQAKPPLGENPFATLPSGEEAPLIVSSTDELIEIPSQLLSPEDAYRLAVDIARRGDLLGWRQLVKKVRKPVHEALHAWRRKYDTTAPSDLASLHEVVDEAVGRVAGLLIIALVGVESGREEISDQRSLIDDLLNIVGWNYSGHTILVELPNTLAYVYQGLHGSMCLNTGQLDLAIALAETKVKLYTSNQYRRVWQHHDLIGWSDSLGKNCTENWRFLAESPKRWEWLVDLFGSELDFQISLAAYYMVLNLMELVDLLAAGGLTRLQQNLEGFLDVPLCCLSGPKDVPEKAMSLLLRDATRLKALWESKGVTREAIEQA